MASGRVRIDDEIELRVVERGDDEFLFAVYRATREDLGAAGLERDVEERLVRMQHDGQERGYAAEYAGADHYVVLFQGEPVGRYMVERRDTELRGVDLAILPEFRGFGIGTRVIRSALSECEATRRPFVLHVLKTNRAQELYLRLGCVVTGETATHYRMEWTPQNER